MIFEVLIGLVTAVGVYILVNYCMHLKQLKQYPPGPWPLPILGNLHLIMNEPHKALKRMSKKHGPVMGFSFGNQRMVVVQGIKEARELLVNKGEAFAGRPQDNYAASLVTRGFKDIIFSDYNTSLKAMRKIAHGALKAYGDGLVKLEQSVLQEAEALFKRFDAKAGKAFDPRSDITLSVANVICALIFGKRYSEDDEEFLYILHSIKLIADFDLTKPLNYVGFLRLFPNASLTNLKRGLEMRDYILDKALKEHKETYDPENLRDFTDFILCEVEKQGKEDQAMKKCVDDENLRLILSDLFLAGIETTTTVLSWCFAYLAACPDVQKKIAEERKEVLGDRMPRLSDRGSLHYFEAVIQEALRMGSVAPLSVPHKTIQNTDCGGHKIPAGTQIWYNVWGIHHDEKQWDEPFSFKPERFIDETGKLMRTTDQSFVPFGAGRRVCIGEALARMEIFVFLSNILYRYDIVADGEAPDLEGEFSVVLKPKPFKIKLKQR